MIELSHVSKSYKIQKKTGWFRSETQMKCAVKDISVDWQGRNRGLYRPQRLR